MAGGRKQARRRITLTTGRSSTPSGGRHLVSLYHLRKRVRAQCVCGWRSKAVPDDDTAFDLGTEHVASTSRTGGIRPQPSQIAATPKTSARYSRRARESTRSEDATTTATPSP